MYEKYLEQLEEAGKIRNLKERSINCYKTFMPRILGTTINETYMGHDWVFSCLPQFHVYTKDNGKVRFLSGLVARL